MPDPRLMKIQSLAPQEIVVRDRARPVSDVKVAALTASFEELGVMMHPIQVWKDKASGDFVLAAGMHRLEAATRLGWTSVPVRAWADVTRDWVEIMELDENLSDPGMTALDTAVFLARRKKIYEEKHPETKRGMAGARAKHSANDSVSFASFSTVVSEIRGCSERSIQRLIRAGEILTPDEVEWLRTMTEPVPLGDLVELSRHEDIRERADLVVALAAGKVKTVKQAVAQRKSARAAPNSRDDVLYMRLCQAYSNATKKARREFVRDFAQELARLVGEVQE